MSPQPSPGRRLRDAIAAETIALPGVWCPLAAKMAERLDFRAVYLSGAALSATLGVPDIGLVTMSEFAEAARAICAATSLPLVCDSDTGFGEALAVERTVQTFEAAGAAGMHLEDQLMPKRCGHLSGKQLVEAATMTAKLKAATRARVDRDFVIIARTDARAVEGFEAAVDRARRYVDAGADAVFPEALESEEEFAAFAHALPGVLLLANMTEFGRSKLLERDTLARMGYRVVLYPVSGLRAALKATRSVLEEIRSTGSQCGKLGDMLTRKELYELLDYDGYDARDRSYFG
jgi:methylisocitrate lyase